MQQSSATLKNDVGIGLRKIVACSHSSSQCLLVSTVFGTVSSLHPTSFLKIFILVSLIFYPGLDLTAVRGKMPYGATRITYTYAHAYCPRELNGNCDMYVQSTIKWRRSKRKSPRWTWILLSEGQILPYYTTDTSRTKIRPSHVKIIVFRPLIWVVAMVSDIAKCIA